VTTTVPDSTVLVQDTTAAPAPVAAVSVTPSLTAAVPAAEATPAAQVAWLRLVRRIGTTDLSGPGVVALGVLLASVGVSVDLVGQPALGMGTGIAVVLFAIVGPAVVRYGSLLTAAVLPPLFVAAAAGALARLGGQNSSSREVALDVGTTLALSAPLVFGATAVGLLVSLVRVGRTVVQRRS